MEALEVHVTLRADDEILSLRTKLAETEAKLAQERKIRDRAEYKYRCECCINQELVDLCRANKVNFRPALEARPFEGR